MKPLIRRIFYISRDYVDPATFFGLLKDHVSSIRPVPTSLCNGHSISVHNANALSSCSHVFLRQDTIRCTFQPFYTGLFRVLSRSGKTFTIRLNCKTTSVNIDEWKPALIDVAPIMLQYLMSSQYSSLHHQILTSHSLFLGQQFVKHSILTYLPVKYSFLLSCVQINIHMSQDEVASSI